MPFGRHKGERLEDLDDDYLRWLAGLDDLREPLKSAVKAEWESRIFASDEPAVSYGLADELISAGVRSLAKKYHPDLGGDTERMQAVNACADWLRSQVRALG
jgi:hypothetical protein